jgi:hypothetical protein
VCLCVRTKEKKTAIRPTLAPTLTCTNSYIHMHGIRRFCDSLTGLSKSWCAPVVIVVVAVFAFLFLSFCSHPSWRSTSRA